MTSDVKKRYQYYATSAPLSFEMCELSFDPMENKAVRICEPSAGQGGIIDPMLKWFEEEAVNLQLKEITAIELMPQNINVLKKKYANSHVPIKILENDFLKYDQYINYFDYVIANPPFSNGQDIEHFKKMYEICKPGGVITSILSTGWMYNSGRKFKKFREWIGIGSDKSHLEQMRTKELSKGRADCVISRVSPCGYDEQISITTYPAGTFKESGTNVITCLVNMRKNSISGFN